MAKASKISDGARPRPSGPTVTDNVWATDDKYGPEKVRRAIARQVAAKVRCVSQLYRNVTADQQADAVGEGFASVMSYWWDRYAGRFPLDLEFDLAVKHGREVAIARLRKDVRRHRHEHQILESLLYLAAPNTVESVVLATAEREAAPKMHGYVREFVARLEKKSRIVIEGRYWNGQTWKDVAATAECSERTAHRLHDRSLVLLREELRNVGILGL